MAADLSLDDVVAARTAIAGRLHRTPMFSSATLSKRIGSPVHLKAELFQRTGSFKPRGVFAKLASLSSEEKARGELEAKKRQAAIEARYAAIEKDFADRLKKATSQAEIEQLQGLKASGAISEDDYQRAKEKVLA